VRCGAGRGVVGDGDVEGQLGLTDDVVEILFYCGDDANGTICQLYVVSFTEHSIARAVSVSRNRSEAYFSL
jgi:hypothetical protein